MGKSLTLKLLLIGLLLVGLLIPLGLLDGLVSERQERGSEVAAEIAGSAGREQVVIGPVLVIDTLVGLRRQKTVSEGGVLREISEIEQVAERRLLAPTALSVEASLRTERRGRGPFEALLFHSQQKLTGEFTLPEPVPLDETRAWQRIKQVRLVLALGDSRGINAIRLRWGDRELAVEPGTSIDVLPQGVNAALESELLPGRALPFSIDLDLSGSGTLGWVPLADENQLALKGDWPHPGFTGAFLPQSKAIGDSGFDAAWTTSRLASRAQQLLAACSHEPMSCAELGNEAIRMRLVDPVDRYLMTDRAIKYALLFMAVVFGAVFFVEVLRAVPVHPMQYGLTGLALAVFFLLLLALSEHLGFAVAYAIAALACGSLIAVYMAGVLGSRRRGGAFAGLLLALYGLLYGLLSSEDFALLAGALALFGMLAVVMLASRRVDWSGVGRGAPASSFGGDKG